MLSLFEKEIKTSSKAKVEDYLVKCKDVEADVTELLSIRSSSDDDDDNYEEDKQSRSSHKSLTF